MSQEPYTVYAVTITPPPDTPSLWFADGDSAYRLDVDDGTRMSPRHRALALALIEFVGTALQEEER